MTQIIRLKEQNKLDENTSRILRRLLRWGSMLIILAFIITQFGIKIDLIAGLVVLASGTVIGFAAMNTLGNAIAGIILMVSRPFKIGDRVFFNGQFADVEEIDLVYTRLKTTNNVIISIPNQKLIQTEIENYGKNNLLRRQYSITAGYDEDPIKIEAVLLEAASKVERIIKNPEPFVWITGFQNFAVEYTLNAFIKDIIHIQEIDSSVRNSILVACKHHGIDISTPNLIRSIEQKVDRDRAK